MRWQGMGESVWLMGGKRELESWKYKIGRSVGKRKGLEGLIMLANGRTDRRRKNRRRARGPMRVESDYLRGKSSKNGGSPAIRTFTIVDACL